MVENCEKVFDPEDEYDSLLNGLSKTFDYLMHDHTVAKLHTYGFSINQ